MRLFWICVIVLCWVTVAKAAPTIPEAFISKRVNEEAPIGTIIATVKAAPSSGDLSYKIDNTAKTWFTINNTGTISVKKRPDREASDFGDGGLLEITVTIKDASGQVTVKVLCIVLDINDNAPQFTNLPRTINVSEDVSVGSRLFTVSAKDKDQNRNGVITYRIVDGNKEGMFEINSVDGYISTAKKLDYEKTTKYNLNISATDGCINCSLSNSSILVITVQDVDDLPANFSQPLYKANIDKASGVGSSVVTVYAEDLDSFKAPVLYGIDPGSNLGNDFAINPSSGLITVNKPLDQEKYTLVVTAKSTDQPEAFAVVQVTVDSTNVTYEASVVENHANVFVFDLEEIERHFSMSNAIFSFISENTGNLFVANNETKNVTVGSTPLDREEKDAYVLFVKASEGQRQGVAKILVTVVDENDNKPVFKSVTPSPSVSVREDAALGTIVLTVQASDKDEGQNGSILYGILAGNDQGKFSIENRTGEVILVKMLDRETADQYVLNISATDSGSPPLVSSTQVNISVLDANDNSPVLSKSNPMEISISEDATPGATVTTVTAQDRDSLENSRIVYSIISGADGKFVIDSSTGAIKTTAALDRETQDVFKLIVRARDNGSSPRSVTAYLTVKVTDINDNEPSFSPASYTGVVFVDSLYGRIVTTVKATDKDIGLNGKVTYRITSGNEDSLFYIEQATGIVKTFNSFAERNGEKFAILVTAFDKGTPQMKSTAKASVNVYVASSEESVVLPFGVTPEVALSNKEELSDLLSTLTGGESFIRYIRPGSNNLTLVTLVSVKDSKVMSVEEQTSAIDRNFPRNMYSKWNIECCGRSGAEPIAVAITYNVDEGISAPVAALIFLSVFIGIAGVVMIIILLRRRKKEVSNRRVKFNPNLLYIDPEERPDIPDGVDRAREARERSFHTQNDDEGSENSNDVFEYTNHAFDEGPEDGHHSGFPNEPYFEEEEDSDDGVNFETFLPPPPTEPPPPPPEFDDNMTAENFNVNMFQVGQHSFTQEESSTDDEVNSIDNDGENSRPESIDSAHSDELMIQVKPTFEDADSGYHGFNNLRRISLEEKTTEL